MSLPAPVQAVLPSLEFNESGFVSLRVSDLEALLEAYLASVAVDEAWYMSQYPDIKQAHETGTLGMTPTEHYRRRGYLEGRLPFEPQVDEEAYRAKYPDVAQDIKNGALPSALYHFISNGYRELRDPQPKVQVAPPPAAETPKGSKRNPPSFRRSGF